MKESKILCVAILYIKMLHFLQQRVKMQFPPWSIDVAAGGGGPVCRSQCAGAQCAWLGRECTVGRGFPSQGFPVVRAGPAFWQMATNKWPAASTKVLSVSSGNQFSWLCISCTDWISKINILDQNGAHESNSRSPECWTSQTSRTATDFGWNELQFQRPWRWHRCGVG